MIAFLCSLEPSFSIGDTRFWTTPIFNFGTFNYKNAMEYYNGLSAPQYYFVYAEYLNLDGSLSIVHFFYEQTFENLSFVPRNDGNYVADIYLSYRFTLTVASISTSCCLSVHDDFIYFQSLVIGYSRFYPLQIFYGSWFDTLTEYFKTYVKEISYA